MDRYDFDFNGKLYSLTEESAAAFINDDEKPVEGLDIKEVLRLLKENTEVKFDKAYYEEPCESCRADIENKPKYFEFLEFYFYVFTKDNKYIISSLSKEYESTSYNKLLKQGKVDNSYIVSIIVCKHCGDYSVQIEQCAV
ncbi:DUF3785 family protein [Clostridium polynesiense]|uniref:DUF3785 family protein n=1 Tax=Clostridium polynesiense TaxID=1325933 RepID=UPI00058FC0AE|nr:DUF3785 family protein [Clostridium polynesiense]